MIKLVIFDLDGTLLNTLDDLAAAGNHALALRGYPIHAVDAFRYFVGDGVAKLVERMTPPAAREPSLLAAVKADFDAYYSAHGTALTAPYAGAIALLDALAARGVACAVLSNKPHAFTAALCPHYFGDRLHPVHGQRQGYPRKPDGALVTEILGISGVSAVECVYVGDSGVDMQTAKNGGVFAIGALWGFRTRDELLENGADALAQTPEEILRFITQKG